MKRPFSKPNPSGLAQTQDPSIAGELGVGSEVLGEEARAALGIIGGSRLNPGGAAWCTHCARVLGRELRGQQRVCVLGSPLDPRAEDKVSHLVEAQKGHPSCAGGLGAPLVSARSFTMGGSPSGHHPVAGTQQALNDTCWSQQPQYPPSPPVTPCTFPTPHPDLYPRWFLSSFFFSWGRGCPGTLGCSAVPLAPPHQMPQ